MDSILPELSSKPGGGEHIVRELEWWNYPFFRAVRGRCGASEASRARASWYPIL